MTSVKPWLLAGVLSLTLSSPAQAVSLWEKCQNAIQRLRGVRDTKIRQLDFSPAEIITAPVITITPSEAERHTNTKLPFTEADVELLESRGYRFTLTHASTYLPQHEALNREHVGSDTFIEWSQTWHGYAGTQVISPVGTAEIHGMILEIGEKSILVAKRDNYGTALVLELPRSGIKRAFVRAR